MLQTYLTVSSFLLKHYKQKEKVYVFNCVVIIKCCARDIQCVCCLVNDTVSHALLLIVWCALFSMRQNVVYSYMTEQLILIIKSNDTVFVLALRTTYCRDTCASNHLQWKFFVL